MIPAARIRPCTRNDLLLALALAAVLVACEASLPTAEDVRRLDVVSLERSVQAVGVSDLVKADYFVDGTPVTADAARAIAPEKISAVRVIRALVRKDGLPSNGDGLTQVRIVTKDATYGTDWDDMEALRADVQAPSRAPRVVAQTQGGGVSADPLLFIDDAQADFAAMKALSPDRIESLTVLKDEIAVKEYGARGANGVIMITTRQ
jgi:TonB-dependent SusC/RagA subfamily outer membrane receptor